MKLYFVRHGRTVWNLEGRFQGASGDSPLLPESVDILKQLGQYLKEVPFDTIYSSDLPRTVKSAEIIQSQLQKPCSLESIPDLREWQLGKLEGLKIATLNAIYPQQIKAFRSNLAQFDTKMFEAESLYSTTQRTIRFIKSLKGSPAENILIVGHGANLTASLRTLLGYKEAHLRKEGGLANASLTVLETDDFETFTLERWNDTSYQEK
ncbi:histidine phosphatase family protein [Streptococcus cristatus]|uniref:histidine phosphatase family protein n=1 Tax=Streptococcus cristatus TaxID=45634 RepID=UPI001C8302AC|nr:histidine phosphatase family protein [Streptococcus cristatus]MBX5325160.1 histidine phosphatase family protein [Streptococcus cristatus]